MVNMADLSFDEVRQVHKDTGSGERRKAGEAFTVDFGDMKSKEGKKNLQESFIKFKKQRQKELRDERRLKERCLRKQGDVEYMNKLRKKFLKRAKKYYGIPYAKKYWKPEQPEYKSHLFLDCCGLVRQVMRDLRKDFGFRLGPWNQAYMYDILPIVVEREEDMKPGDLVFISGTYPRPNARQQKHLMTHVEIWAGEGTKTIGARWNNGKVQLWDDYRFEAKSFVDAKYHFRSIDTWLQGVCRSFCPEHKWRRTFSPSKKSIFSEDVEKDKANRQKADNNTNTKKQVKDEPVAASPPGKDEELEDEQVDEDMEEEDEEEEEAAEPACESDEEGLDCLPGEAQFLMSPHNACGKVKYNGSNKRFPQRQPHTSTANSTPVNESDQEDSEDSEDLSIGGKMASLNISETSVTRLDRLHRSHTDILSSRSLADHESQRLLSQSVQELPTRFPVIINDVGKAKPNYKSGYDRIKNLSDRCLASPRGSLPVKQESTFKTKKKSMEERRRIFSDLEQSKSVLLIDNDISDEEIDELSTAMTITKIKSNEALVDHSLDHPLDLSSDPTLDLSSDQFVKLPSDDFVNSPLGELENPLTDKSVDLKEKRLNENNIIEQFEEDGNENDNDPCGDVFNGRELNDSKDSNKDGDRYDSMDEDSVKTVPSASSQMSQDDKDEDGSSQGDHVVTN